MSKLLPAMIERVFFIPQGDSSEVASGQTQASTISAGGGAGGDGDDDANLGDSHNCVNSRSQPQESGEAEAD